MRRVFWILLTPIAGFALLWVFLAFVIAPRFESWALNKIQVFSQESLPVLVKAQKIQFHFFKPSLSLEGIDINPKENLNNLLQPMRVASARVYLDFFSLLGGRLNLSALVVDSPELKINIDSLLDEDSPAKELPINEIFAQTEKLPLQRLLLRNLHLQLSSEKLKFESVINSGDVLLTNMGKNLTLKASVPTLQLDLKKRGSYLGSLDTHLYLTRQALKILQLGLKSDHSEILARGEINPISHLGLKPQGIVNLNGKISLADLYKEISGIKSDIKIPLLSGSFDFDTEVHFAGLQDIRGKTEIKTKDVVVGQIQLGDAKIQGEYKDRRISLSEIKLHHPAGEAKVTHAQMELKDSYNFETQAVIESLDAQKLFSSLHLKDIPVGMNVNASVPCRGRVFPEISVECEKVQISAKDIWVKTGMQVKDLAVLNLDHLRAQGKIQYTPSVIRYSTNLEIAENSGTSEGVIDFQKGFNIQFATKNLDFKNIKNLAQLKLQGSAEISGTTTGTSNSAIFDMSFSARNFIFEGFTLGNLISNIRYRAGVLNFEDIAGALEKTQYLGNLNLDLKEHHLLGDFSVPTAELTDIATLLSGLVKLPFPVQGQGAAKAHVEGPLNFWKMSYKLQSSFKNVFIGPESFDSLVLNAHAQNGNMGIEKAQLLKGDASLKLQGGIDSNQVMNLYADARGFRLEQSDIISHLNSNILGSLNFSAEIKDSIKDPQILVKGSVNETSLDEQDIPNSHFILKVSKDLFGANLSLFGDRVKGDIQIPLIKNRKPLSIKVVTKDWNYSTLLGLAGGASLVGEYDSSLTSKIDLQSESGGLMKASGQIEIDKVSLKRGALSLTNPLPIKMIFKEGSSQIQDFRLVGPNADFSVQGKDFTPEAIDIGINLQADMRLFQIFLPFLEDLGGGINVSTKVTGAWDKPLVLGNLNTRNVFLKIKGLPHPIERLNTDVVFSQSRILISSIHGVMAGGTLSGDGGLLIGGIRDLPTSIRLHLEGVTFNIPDKVRSSGNADLLFSGNWFPFTLSGTYYISNASMEKELGGDSSSSSGGVKQSQYLPKFIRENQFESLLLDMQLVMENNITVKNSLLEGAVSGNLQIKGSPSNPVLLGRITTDRNTKLIVKDRVFNIQNGVIDFNDPNEINPNLYITAISRVNEYDVTVVAQGPSKNLNIRMSSIPPLPENDIISLIALGVITSSNDQNLQARQQQSEKVGAEIGGAVLAAPINKQLQATGFNVAVTQQYDSYRSVSVPKITLSRSLTEKVKISGSRPVGDSQSYDVRMEYKINNNYTAVGSYEIRGTESSSTGLQQGTETTSGAQENIFGLDLEFKREFK